MKHRILFTVITVFALVVCMSGSCLAFDNIEADALKSLGLFKGTDKGYDLDSNATRVQTAVTFARLLGKEKKAVAQKNAHPFDDVPSWASDCVGWLYENYLVNGISKNMYGSNDNATPKQFVTMLLRSLEYSDSGKDADFSYNGALEFAREVELLSDDDYAKYASQPVLKRGDMVHLSYIVLGTNINNARKTLAEKLCYEQRVFTESQGVDAEVMTAFSPDSFFDGVEVNISKMAATVDGFGTMHAVLSSQVESFGLRLYASVDGELYDVIPSQYSIAEPYWEMTATHYEGAAQMMTEFEVHNLPEFEESITFILAKTTSTTNMYKYVGRTPSVTVKKSEVRK